MKTVQAIMAAALAAGAIVQGLAATFAEDFASNPLTRGWRVHGNAALFRWDAARQHLAVTWDSSQTNSFFAFPLGTVLARDDDFQVALDLWLEDLAVGVAPGKPSGFELAFGFLNWHQATNAHLRRGVVGNPLQSPRNLVEFDYFPDAGFGATVWPALVSSNGQFNYHGFGDFVLQEMDPQHTYHVTLRYTGADAALATTVLRDGQPLTTHRTVLMEQFSDFRLDTFAVTSYSDAGFNGSLLAHGAVDNVRLTVPNPPRPRLVVGFSNTVWQVTFASRSNWLYTLEWSSNLSDWISLAPGRVGAGDDLVLTDTNQFAVPRRFYRVNATRP